MVQNSARLLCLVPPPPRGVSRGTDKLKAPVSKCFVHLATRSCRCLAEVGVLASSGKKDGSERRAKVCVKSGGVTSETNQGISFGLKDEKDQLSVLKSDR